MSIYASAQFLFNITENNFHRLNQNIYHINEINYLPVSYHLIL